MTKLFSWLVSYWYLVVPLIMGFTAVASLLPHAGKRRIPVQGGLACAILAILLTGLLITRSSNDVAMDFFFGVFAIVSVASAGAVVVQHNPVYSALYFAITVLGVCGLFLVKSASFLAAATIIVYAGAIIVTFLFVIMLAQQTGLADYDRRSRERIFSCLAGFVLLGAILFIIEKNFTPKADVSKVIAVLKEGTELTAKDRYPRSGREIISLLQIDGQAAESLLLPMFDGLPGWPEASDRKADATKAFTQLRKNLQEDKTMQAHDQLRLLYTLAMRVEEMHKRASHVLTVSATESKYQPVLSQRMDRKNRDHVNELGVSLFGDYLYAVELAGTLLLVATIAAILIAQESGHRKAAQGSATGKQVVA